MPLPENSGEALDPRLLLKRVNELESRLKTLEANSIAFNAHQQGPLPGFLRAVQINDPNQSGSMWINFQNSGPGSGPYSAVTDTNGVIRAEWGNLAANGISAAQFGFRVNDANHNPAFDSQLGLIQALTVLASNFVSAAFTTSSTTPVLITGSAVTVNPTHQTRVVVLYGGAVAYSGQTAFIDLFLDAANQSGGGNGPALELQFPTTSSGAVTSTGFFTTVLAAGSHTIDLRASQNGINSLTVEECAVLVLALGVV